MNDSEDLQRAIENLRERLSRLSRASLRIAGDLDPDAVLQETVDGARSLTGARYDVLAVLDDAGQVESLLASGLTPDEFQGLRVTDFASPDLRVRISIRLALSLATEELDTFLESSPESQPPTLSPGAATPKCAVYRAVSAMRLCSPVTSATGVSGPMPILLVALGPPDSVTSRGVPLDVRGISG